MILRGKIVKIVDKRTKFTKIVQQKLILSQWQIKTRNQFEFGAMDGRLL